jgi:hypothetical protein
MKTVSVADSVGFEVVLKKIESSRYGICYNTRHSEGFSEPLFMDKKTKRIFIIVGAVLK